jgi:hypothetical protein
LARADRQFARHIHLDQDPLSVRDQRGRRYGDVVEEAEAHGPVPQGVVARRAGGDECDISRSRLERIHRGQTGPSCSTGCGP